MSDLIVMTVDWTIDRGQGPEPLGHNEITTGGLQHVLDVLFGLASPPMNQANTFIGVGDSTSAFSAGQTDLQAATNKLRRGISLGFPSRAAQTVTCQATFNPGDASFHWQEYGLFWAAAGASTMLSRRVQDLGTKAGGDTWSLEASVSLA